MQNIVDLVIHNVQGYYIYTAVQIGAAIESPSPEMELLWMWKVLPFLHPSSAVLTALLAGQNLSIPKFTIESTVKIHDNEMTWQLSTIEERFAADGIVLLAWRYENYFELQYLMIRFF